MTDSQKLTVAAINAFDSYGGAERVVLELHRAYLERDIDSWVLLGSKTVNLPHVIEVDKDAGRGMWARTLLRLANRAATRSAGIRDLPWIESVALRALAEPNRSARRALGHEDFDFPHTPGILDALPTPPDVLHFHNLHGGFFDIRALPGLTQRYQSIATLHDAWLLTGHCAHPLDCTRWQSGCGECPDLEMYVRIPRDASAANWRVKYDAVSRSRLRVATPSKWLMNLVEQSPMAERLLETRVIPNGVDTTVFSPGSKSEARHTLGLCQDAVIVLFVARGLAHNRFKDYSTLVSALRRVVASRPKVTLLALGADKHGEVPVEANVTPIPYVDDPGNVALYYRAADVYVHAARAENLPLAVIEAMACGAPVVASNVGGVPELVADDETGLLVSVADDEGMAQAIVRLLDDSALRESLSAAAGERVASRFTLERQVEAYLNWYGEIASIPTQGS